VADDPLTAEVPSSFDVPHSRWNDVPGDELADCGYRVLTRDKEGGVDAFVKQQKSLFVFFQGHPEYETDTLLLEYRRDVGSYLRRERSTFPEMPEGYFDDESIDMFRSLREEILSKRSKELPVTLSGGHREKRIVNTWSSPARRIYRNWIEYLCVRDEQLGQTRHR
jgi:homoserine O-succinyltransferase